MQPLRPSDEELLAAAVSDSAMFEVFFRRHAPAILSFFARRVDEPEAAADLMAETFAAAMLGTRRFVKAPDSALSWLYAIARNKLNDYYRHRAVHRDAMKRLGIERRELDDGDLERIEKLAEVADIGVMVGRELEGLPDDQRYAVTARVVDERSYREIAEELGESETAVRKRVSRGLSNLRKGMSLHER